MASQASDWDWFRALSREKRDAVRTLHAIEPAKNLIALAFIAGWFGVGWMVVRIPSYLIRGFGILLMGIFAQALAVLAHDAMHGTFVRRRRADRVFAFILAAPSLISASAYRVCHLLHHSHTRTERDPDEFSNLTSNASLLSFYFYAWGLIGMALYLIYVPITALRQGSLRERAIVIIEYATIGIAAVAVFWLARRTGHLSWVWLCWIGPLGVTAVLGNVRSWAEHLLTRKGHPLGESRTIVSNRLVSLLMCNINYHLEHHLFPGVPWYNLPKLRALLRNEYPQDATFEFGSYFRFFFCAVRGGVHAVAVDSPAIAAPPA